MPVSLGCCCLLLAASLLMTDTSGCFLECIEYDSECPENHYPFYCFEFSHQEVKGNTLSVAGFNFTKSCHVMDLVLDRYRVYIAGENRNIVVLEIPLVEYPMLHEYQKFAMKRKKLKGNHYESIAKQEKLAHNKIIQRDAKKRFYIEFDEAVTLSADYFPFKRMTTGDEVDYDFVPVESTVYPTGPSKKSYVVTTVTASWKVTAEHSVEPVDLAKAASGRGASKFDEMEELADGVSNTGFN